MDKSRHRLADSFVETIKSSDLSTIFENAAEIWIDSVLDQGFVRDIPVVGTLLRVGKATTGIRDYILIKKILLFLKGIDNVPLAERQDFVKKMSDNSSFRTRVGENLIMLLDRLDDFDKPRLVAKLFCHLLGGRISYDDFIRLTNSIDRAFISDLRRLLSYFRRPEQGHGRHALLDETEQSLWQSLFSAGLAKFKTKTEFKHSGSKRASPLSARPITELPGLSTNSRYVPNEVAERLARLLLNDKFDEVSFRR